MRADVRVPGTLPRPLSSFIGREDVLAEITQLLEHGQPLTLTGPGGSGKTRLSIELARRVAADYPDGAHFVSLASIRDPELVPSAIARALGLQDSRDRPLVVHLASYLSDRTLLLVLDNFEHVLSCAHAVAELLATGSGSRIVVTSRSPLRLTGEQEFPVPPLVVPDAGDDTTFATLVACESIALFGARARAVAPDFTVDAGNAALIAAITRRLDGLPLAIELAAARVKVLPPAALLARLDDALGLLVGGSRDLPDRQQSLHSTISWSHDLLGQPTRRLLAVLAAFRGGAALADLESVCAAAVDLGVPALDGVQELLDQSLLRLSATSERPRYAMLETVREFAVARLDERPEADAVRAAHAAVFARLAELIRPPPIFPDNEFLAVLDDELDNMRAALDWLQEHDPATALRMAANLTAFWTMRGHFTEGRRRLHNLLGLVAGETRDRVAALNGAAWLAMDQGEVRTPTDLLDDALRLARAIGDPVGEGTVLLSRGRNAIGASDLAGAGRDLADALTILTGARDSAGVTVARLLNGVAALMLGDLDTARAHLAECVARCAELGLRNVRARALQLIGIARLRAGDVSGARTTLAEALPMVVASGDRFGITIGLLGLIELAAATARPRLALRLSGVLDEFAHVYQVAPPQPMHAHARALLGPIEATAGAAAERLRAEGRGMALGDAVAAALSDEPERPWRTGTGPALTRREVEVAQLVAGGLTNREVAARLYLSVRTVDVHVDRILTKLGFRSRGQLTAWAHEAGLMTKVT
ncbi:MAG: LuxR C-terminal-related transcriptional regulator [Pseudonocardia sp.]|nr:LuxR C-terminal-related transcriptional regulator [Pseudonocardia sp.]